jgi:hypothetical protein
MSLTGPDAQRTRFRRPLGVAVMVYKAILGLSEIVVGVLLAATVALLLPLDLRQAVVDPTVGHVLLAAANAAALVVLVLLLRGRPTS